MVLSVPLRLRPRALSGVGDRRSDPVVKARHGKPIGEGRDFAGRPLDPLGLERCDGFSDPRRARRAVEDADVRTAETDDRGFTTTFEGVGAFPSAEYIRVIWLGVGRGASELIALHRRIEAETTALGYDATDHDFTPHVTLARMDDATSKGSVQSFLETTDPEIGPLRVEDLRLTESTLTTEGPEYRTVARIEI